MAWEYLGLGSMLLSLTIGVIRLLGFDAAYVHSTGADATKKASGSSLMEVIRKDSLIDAAMEVGSVITLASAREGVAYALWNTFEEAARDEKIANWETKAEEIAKETQDQRDAMNGSSDKGKEKKPESKKSKK